jgi:low affinity Fe/Cu permease
MHAARYNRQMATQNYSNHVRLVPGFHFVLAGILFLTLIGSLVNLYKSWGLHCQVYSAALIVVLVVCCGFLFNYTRVFPLKAQDRAIRAEENLRHFVLTGKLLDARLAVGQIVALRFAPDNEFVDLARKAADGNMPPADIKRAIKNWKADTYRA